MAIKTLNELIKADEEKQSLIAKLQMDLNQKHADRTAAETAYEAAIADGETEKAKQLKKQEVELGLDEEVLSDMIDKVQKRRVCTDEDCINVANAESQEALKKLAQTKLEIAKLTSRLSIAIKDMAELHSQTIQTRFKCLAYRSDFATDIVTEQRYYNSGLQNLPNLSETINQYRLILLCAYGQDEADAIINTFARTL